MFEIAGVSRFMGRSRVSAGAKTPCRAQKCATVSERIAGFDLHTVVAPTPQSLEGLPFEYGLFETIQHLKQHFEPGGGGGTRQALRSFVHGAQVFRGRDFGYTAFERGLGLF